MTTEHLLGALAVVGPIAGLTIGAAVGASRKRLVPLAAKGYLIGYLGLFVYMVWASLKWGSHYDKYVRIPVSWKQDQPKDMRELIDADTAEKGVIALSAGIVGVGVLVMFIAFIANQMRILNAAFYAIIGGALIQLLWSAYNWHCRYDPVTNYFGLEKVRVLGVNFAMFIATGVAMGILWALMTTKKPVAELLGGSMAERPEPPSHSATQQPNKEK